MTLDGIAAVQARIQEIRQQLSGVSPAPAAETARSGASTSADFASTLSSAMGSSAMGSSAMGTSALGTSALGTQSATGATDLASTLGLSGSGVTGGGVGGTDLSSLLAQVTGSAASPAAGAAANPIANQFVSTALSQSGKPYVWASSASASDPNPVSFDCSELTKWAAARSGVTIPDGAAHQYVWLKEQGATMTVQQALQTPGALLFSFAGEPQPGLSGEPPHAHVAISLGNGKTIEAKGHAYGVGVFDAGDRFNYAGMIPGMS
jgi:cell wall-associated NlpC family hydrolase